MTGNANHKLRCFLKNTSLARIWHINSYKLYHCQDPRDIRDLLEILRWPGEASLRRWRSVEATSYLLSCSSLLSAWPGARSLRLLVLVVVFKVSKYLWWWWFQSFKVLVVMLVSKMRSKSLCSQIYTAHSIVTSILTSMFIGVSIDWNTNKCILKGDLIEHRFKGLKQTN